MNTSVKKNMIVPFKKDSLSEDGTFAGYGSIFGVKDSDNEIVEKGAFEDSLMQHKSAGRLPLMLWQHDTRQPIGVYTEMKEDEQGLYVKGRLLLDLQKGKEAYTLLKEGVITGLSIGVNTLEDEYDRQKGVRILKRVSLWEVSLVTFPSNAAAQIQSVKSADSIETAAQFERMLRNNGYSQKGAKIIASKGFNEFLKHREGGKKSDEEHRDGDDLAELNKKLNATLQMLKGD